MSAISVTLLALLSANTLAFAQTTSPTSSQIPQPGQKISGCLTGSEGNYMLRAANGATYRLEGEESQLKRDLNREVTVEVADPNSSKTGGIMGGAESVGRTVGQGAQDAGEAVVDSTKSVMTGNKNNTDQNKSTTSSQQAGTAAIAAMTIKVKDVEKISDTCTTTP